MPTIKPYLSLSNILLPSDKVINPPSLTDYISIDFDFELRVRGCELIQEAGVLLKLPQVSIATAQLLYQRYFFIKSFVKYNFEVIAMATTFLASKIDESPRRPRDVINVFHHIRQLENKEAISPLILDQYYINVKTQVIKSERRILKELGFAVHSQHPHKLLIIYLQTLECEKNQRLVQIAWNYLNDSYKTNVYVRFQPPSIACACIFLSARHLQFPLPNNPPWYKIFNVTLEEIQEISLQLFKLYTRTQILLKNIDKTLNVSRKLYELNKIQMLANDAASSTTLSATFSEVVTYNPKDASAEENPTIIDENTKNINFTKIQPDNSYLNAIDSDNLLLAQQRLSLLYSIQEQKKKKKYLSLDSSKNDYYKSKIKIKNVSPNDIISKSSKAHSQKNRKVEKLKIGKDEVRKASNKRAQNFDTQFKPNDFSTGKKRILISLNNSPTSSSSSKVIKSKGHESISKKKHKKY
ncbi:unnamed protein product [Gordionus sp. m RMFG-2023]|uniref:cyclin-L1-like n=1 Tax=Gordionus sp. m RMFG-2023 TaxID=3053472 RepID=UPI0030E53A6D